MIRAFSKVSGKEVAYKIVDRRSGDIGICYANPSKANSELGWYATKDIYDMCEDC